MNRYVFAARNIADKLFKVVGSWETFKFYWETYVLSRFEAVEADVYIVSYPKCGRTWLRLMIGRTVSQHFNLPQDEAILFLRWGPKPDPLLPMITVVHEDRPMLKRPEELERSKEKFRHKRVIFLVRDPRDVIVSSDFEMK